jgi:hypothetical protein
MEQTCFSSTLDYLKQIHFGDGVKPCGSSCGLAPAPTPVAFPKATNHPIGTVLLIVGLAISLGNDIDTEPLEKEVELCNCCEIEMEPGGQFTIWTNCRQIPKDECSWQLQGP